MARGGPDIESLRLTREESRVVLNHHLSLLNDLDDKAMRTVRTAVILLGILVSAAGISGVERLGALPVVVLFAFGSGSVLLLVTAIIGVATYTLSDMSFGVGSDHRREVSEGNYSEEEWLLLLFEEYDRWSSEMAQVNQDNASRLFVSQAALIASLVLLSGGAAGLLYATL